MVPMNTDPTVPSAAAASSARAEISRVATLTPVTFGVTFGDMTKRPRCAWCERAFDPPKRGQGGGRIKRYCSARCRVAANRQAPGEKRCAICTVDQLDRLKRATRATLDAYGLYLDSDDLDVLRDALTAQETGLDPGLCMHLEAARKRTAREVFDA